MRNKKVIALLLTVCMAGSILGSCGKLGGSSDQGKDVGGKAKISMMVMDHMGTALKNEGAEEVVKLMEDYTNTTVDFKWVANDSYNDKLGVTLLNSKDMPMIITLGDSKLTSTVVQAANAGAFWDLNDFIFDKEKYPNLSQANTDVLKQLEVDGKLIGIYRARAIGRNGLGYRKDWADKLGLGEPKTVEDVYNMAKAFREQDPDGNGKKDTYGIALCKYTGPLDIMQAWFGAGNGWVEQDGKLIPQHMTDEYMEALTWFKKMYDEELVYKDWAVRDTNTWADAVKNGECGMYVDVLDGSKRIWDYFVTNEIPAVNGDATATMGLVGAIAKEEGGTPVNLATSGMGGYYVITKSAKTEKDVEACLNFLDKMCDDEMLTLADHGIEGTYWNLEDGKLVDIPTGKEASEIQHNGLNQLLCYIPNMYQTSPEVKVNERDALDRKIKEETEQYCVFNPAAGYQANSATYSKNGGNLDQILMDSRTQYICGEIDEAGLKKAWDNWASQGGTAVIEEVNAQYEKDK